jgi:hypothetical protein
MKNSLKTIHLVALTTIFFISTFLTEAVAQKYFVYDGDTFSVLITTDNDNTKITNIEFSDNDEWHKFEILDYSDMDDTDEGGFIYEVKDGVGNIYYIDYYRDEDYMVVFTEDWEDFWELRRRDE